MKEYLDVKKINAEPMDRQTYNDYRGWIVPPDENPTDAGFLAKHSSGHVCWLPKKEFLENCVEIGNNTLLETVELMKSTDFRDRFKAEYTQLKIRCDGLLTMITKFKNNELPFEPKCSLELLEKQLDEMNKYLGTLEERAFIEEIELY